TGTSGLKSLNYNQSSQSASLTATTGTGFTALTNGAGLSTVDRAFGITYKGTALNVLVAADPAINDTASALAAIQDALDQALVANGFAAGDVLANANAEDLLSFSPAAAGFD